MAANGHPFDGCCAWELADTALRGLASALARPENDSTLAMVQEVAGLHYKLISGTLPKLRSGELWSLADQDGELIARSSRVLEAFQAEVDSAYLSEERRAASARDRVRLWGLLCDMPR